MNTKTLVTRTVIVFVALAIAGLFLAMSGRSLADSSDQIVLVAVGSAMFGAALAFFLTRIFALTEK
jgi:hypothetical protein